MKERSLGIDAEPPELQSISQSMKSQIEQLFNYEATLLSLRDFQQRTQHQQYLFFQSQPQPQPLQQQQQQLGQHIENQQLYSDEIRRLNNSQIKQPMPLRNSAVNPLLNNALNFIPSHQGSSASSKITPSSIKTEQTCHPLNKPSTRIAEDEKEFFVEVEAEDDDEDEEEEYLGDQESILNQRSRLSTSAATFTNVQESQSSSNTSPLANAEQIDSVKFFVPYEGKLLIPQPMNSSLTNSHYSGNNNNNNNSYINSQNQINKGNTPLSNIIITNNNNNNQGINQQKYFVPSPFSLQTARKQEDSLESYFIKHTNTPDCQCVQCLLSKYSADSSKAIHINPSIVRKQSPKSEKNKQSKQASAQSQGFSAYPSPSRLNTQQVTQTNISPTTAIANPLLNNGVRQQETPSSTPSLSNLYLALQNYAANNPQKLKEQFKNLFKAMVAAKAAQNINNNNLFENQNTNQGQMKLKNDFEVNSNQINTVSVIDSKKKDNQKIIDKLESQSPCEIATNPLKIISKNISKNKQKIKPNIQKQNQQKIIIKSEINNGVALLEHQEDKSEQIQETTDRTDLTSIENNGKDGSTVSIALDPVNPVCETEKGNSINLNPTTNKKCKKFPSVIYVEGNKKFECQICQKTFDSKQKLGGHKARAHPLAPCQRTDREQKKLQKQSLSTKNMVVEKNSKISLERDLSGNSNQKSADISEEEEEEEENNGFYNQQEKNQQTMEDRKLFSTLNSQIPNNILQLQRIHCWNAILSRMQVNNNNIPK